MNSLNEVIQTYLEAFANADYSTLQNLLEENVIAYITNAKAGVDEVIGRDNYLNRVKKLDVLAAKLSMQITQSVLINSHQILVMIEIHAERKGKSLRNYAAHLIEFTNEKISKMWMVEALPAFSDEFWL